MNRFRASFLPLFLAALLTFSTSCGGGGGSTPTSSAGGSTSGGGSTGGSGAPSTPAAVKFAPRVDIPTGGLFSAAIVAADFNQDGRPDLVVANGTSKTLTYFQNQGSGTFSLTSTIVPTGLNFLRRLATADLNEDGKPDLLVSADPGATVFLGSGGTFTQQPPLVAGIGFFEIARLVDLNGDHHLDAVLGYFGSLSVAMGNGDGTFNAPVSLPPFLPASQPSLFIFGLDVGDFNRDGKPDILAADYSPNSIGLGAVDFYAGNGDGTFAAPTSQTLNLSNPTSLAALDLNRDGNLDALVGYAPGSASAILGNGNGTFKTDFNDQKVAYAAGGGGSGMTVAVADLNADGIPDAIGADFTRGVLVVTLGMSDGNFDQSHQQQFTIAPGLASIAVADFNGDGLPDIAVVNNQTNLISVFLSLR